MSFENDFKKQTQKLYKQLILGFSAIFLSLFLLVYVALNPSIFQKKPKESEVVEISVENENTIENGIHVATGLVEGKGMIEVIQNCTNCHSAKLVTQNRMTKEGWIATIRWMQETQNLWDLGDQEEIIVSYLASYYAPEEKGRRENLTSIEWYPLEED